MLKITKASAAEIRKQLLIAESEVNRTLLQREWRAMTVELRAAVRPAKEISWIISAIAIGGALFKALRHDPVVTEPPLHRSFLAFLRGLLHWLGRRRQSK